MLRTSVAVIGTAVISTVCDCAVVVCGACLNVSLTYEQA
jgi:hypothetical protein